MNGKRSFASDNNSGAHPLVLEKLAESNFGHVTGYGHDIFTERAKDKFKGLFGNDIDVFFVFNGTAANILSIKALANSYNAVFCADTSHVHVDECGGLENFCGCKIIPLKSSNGKIEKEQIGQYLNYKGNEQRSQPGVVSITQPTEYGLLYTVEEIKALTRYAHENGMFVHMDGARIANGIAAMDLDINEMTRDAGIDALSFGGTKNGMMFGDAVVFFNRDLSRHFIYIQKQGMQLASKMRFISIQFEALLSGGLWLDNAKHSNRMARLLYEKIRDIPQVEITRPVETNMVFAKVPEGIIKALQKNYFFYILDEANSEVRWVTSFDTQDEDIDGFVLCLKKLLK